MVEFGARDAIPFFPVQEPPFLIDGALVVAHARFGEPQSGVAGGVAIDDVRALVVTQSLADRATYLLYCNGDWETLAAERHGDTEAAQRAAGAHFPPVAWTSFRKLTAAEAAEVESTRAFLQDLTRDFPGGT